MKRMGLPVGIIIVVTCLFGGAVEIVVGQSKPGESQPPIAVDEPPTPLPPALANEPAPAVPKAQASKPERDLSAPAIPDAPPVPPGDPASPNNNPKSQPAPVLPPDSLPLETVPRGRAPFENNSPFQGIPFDEGAVPTNDNPTGRQESSVSLEWIGPPVAKLGQPATYQIVVVNLNTSPVHQVRVWNRLPAGVNVLATEPHTINQGNILVWEVGTLAARQEKCLNLKLLAKTKGDFTCQAMVTFSGTSTARLRVREPKLMLKASAPEKVLVGDNATIALTVTNPGDGTADRVKVKAVLSDGLENARGRTVDFDLGNLGPNETRSVQLVCTSKAGGPQKCEAVAIAEGNLLAKDAAVVDVILPRLTIEATGPKLRYLERHAIYVFKVTNPGTAPANNVSISDQIPLGFKFASASGGGQHDFNTRTVSWFVGDLAPGQSREVSLEVVAINAGEHLHKANAIAARGLRTNAEVLTRVEGLPALLMELVDLDDPVEVGVDTAYEVRVTNTGSKTETNLQLVCLIPDKMEFRGAQCVAGCPFHLHGKELIFDPLPKLAPRADALYRIQVRGTAPGDLRFRARINADGLSEPVLKEESTKVYGDDQLPNK
jgi:uncharacterized repeat protein (TIGR01451 family)